MLTRREFLRTSLAAGAASLLVAGADRPGAAAAATRPYRAFRRSYWNRRLPEDVPIAPGSARMLQFIAATSGDDYLKLSGTSESGEWGVPIYWAKKGDPTYSVRSTGSELPPEFDRLRIPRGVKPDPTSDGGMTVFDRGRGWVAWLFRAEYDPARDRWSAGGGSIHYLDSNGLDRRWRCPNRERRNRGHRGMPGAVLAVRYDEVEAGVIAHALRMSVPAAADRAVFPMVGSDGDSDHPDAPPEGARIRIKRSVDLSRLRRQGKLNRAAFVVATALQEYGAVVGDEGSGSVKVENTVAEGRGWLWEGKLTRSSLAAIPLDAYEVVRLGWGRCG